MIRFLKNFMIAAWLVLLVASCDKAPKHVFNVRDYGAPDDTTSMATEAIQKAIDKCTASGGGEVYFPPGEYLAGTIVLKDNVTLYLESGATLFASQDTNHYKNDFIVIKSDDSGKEGAGETPVFIYAKGAKNIGIKGKGTIHGQARRTYEDLKKVDGFIEEVTHNARKAGVEMKMYYKVPPFVCLVFLESCNHVTIRDVSMIESTDWTLHFKWSDRIFVDNVYIESSLEEGVNSDGIDIDGCKDVVITNSIISTGDDAIVLKSTMTYPNYRDCENVTVNNCVLTSTSTALKLGTESYGDFRNITFNNCVIRNTNRGLSIVVRDGALVENVMFSDITIETNRKHFNWWGNGDPIWLVVKKRFPDSKIGTIRNINFNNIIAYGQGTSKIEGYPGHPMENIRLKNVQFHMFPEDYPDKRADDAFYASEVKGLNLRDVCATWNEDPEPAWRNAFTFEKVDRLRLSGLEGAVPPIGDGAFIEMQSVNDALIENCRPGKGTDVFLRLNGSDNASIIGNNNYLQGVDKHLQILNGGDLSAVSGF
jgi:hypothetical protein